jgi:CheY-like chemotaxis protein
MERRPILVVDDDDLILSSVESTLVDEGYPVVTAPDGAAALDAVEQQSPALILLDMKMPILDGWAFARAYREQPEPRAPIVVMTAAADAARRAADVGAEGYLAKPFDLEDLLSLVGRMMQKA